MIQVLSLMKETGEPEYMDQKMAYSKRRQKTGNNIDQEMKDGREQRISKGD